MLFGVLRVNRLLIVEGRLDVADLLQQMVSELNFEAVVANDLKVAEAEAFNAEVCCALLAVNFGLQKSYSIADILATRRIPFAFVNSQGRSGLDRAYWSRPVLIKPFKRQQVVQVIDLLKREANQANSTVDRKL
jgi:DNA-binding response OmpR family regulator